MLGLLALGRADPASAVGDSNCEVVDLTVLPSLKVVTDGKYTNSAGVDVAYSKPISGLFIPNLLWNLVTGGPWEPIKYKVDVDGDGTWDIEWNLALRRSTAPADWTKSNPLDHLFKDKLGATKHYLLTQYADVGGVDLSIVHNPASSLRNLRSDVGFDLKVTYRCPDGTLQPRTQRARVRVSSLAADAGSGSRYPDAARLSFAYQGGGGISRLGLGQDVVNDLNAPDVVDSGPPLSVGAVLGTVSSAGVYTEDTNVGLNWKSTPREFALGIREDKSGPARELLSWTAPHGATPTDLGISVIDGPKRGVGGADLLNVDTTINNVPAQADLVMIKDQMALTYLDTSPMGIDMRRISTAASVDDEMLISGRAEALPPHTRIAGTWSGRDTPTTADDSLLSVDAGFFDVNSCGAGGTTGDMLMPVWPAGCHAGASKPVGVLAFQYQNYVPEDPAAKLNTAAFPALPTGPKANFALKQVPGANARSFYRVAAELNGVTQGSFDRSGSTANSSKLKAGLKLAAVPWALKVGAYIDTRTSPDEVANQGLLISGEGVVSGSESRQGDNSLDVTYESNVAKPFAAAATSSTGIAVTADASVQLPGPDARIVQGRFQLGSAFQDGRMPQRLAVSVDRSTEMLGLPAATSISYDADAPQRMRAGLTTSVRAKAPGWVVVKGVKQLSWRPIRMRGFADVFVPQKIKIKMTGDNVNNTQTASSSQSIDVAACDDRADCANRVDAWVDYGSPKDEDGDLLSPPTIPQPPAGVHPQFSDLGQSGARFVYLDDTHWGGHVQVENVAHGFYKDSRNQKQSSTQVCLEMGSGNPSGQPKFVLNGYAALGDPNVSAWGDVTLDRLPATMFADMRSDASGASTEPLVFVNTRQCSTAKPQSEPGGSDDRVRMTGLLRAGTNSLLTLGMPGMANGDGLDRPAPRSNVGLDAGGMYWGVKGWSAAANLVEDVPEWLSVGQPVAKACDRTLSVAMLQLCRTSGRYELTETSEYRFKVESPLYDFGSLDASFDYWPLDGKTQATTHMNIHGHVDRVPGKIDASVRLDTNRRLENWLRADVGIAGQDFGTIGDVTLEVWDLLKPAHVGDAANAANGQNLVPTYKVGLRNLPNYVRFTGALTTMENAESAPLATPACKYSKGFGSAPYVGRGTLGSPGYVHVDLDFKFTAHRLDLALRTGPERAWKLNHWETAADGVTASITADNPIDGELAVRLLNISYGKDVDKYGLKGTVCADADLPIRLKFKDTTGLRLANGMNANLGVDMPRSDWDRTGSIELSVGEHYYCETGCPGGQAGWVDADGLSISYFNAHVDVISAGLLDVSLPAGSRRDVTFINPNAQCPIFGWQGDMDLLCLSPGFTPKNRITIDRASTQNRLWTEHGADDSGSPDWVRRTVVLDPGTPDWFRSTLADLDEEHLGFDPGTYIYQTMLSSPLPRNFSVPQLVAKPTKLGSGTFTLNGGLFESRELAVATGEDGTRFRLQQVTGGSLQLLAEFDDGTARWARTFWPGLTGSRCNQSGLSGGRLTGSVVLSPVVGDGSLQAITATTCWKWNGFFWAPSDFVYQSWIVDASGYGLLKTGQLAAVTWVNGRVSLPTSVTAVPAVPAGGVVAVQFGDGDKTTLSSTVPSVQHVYALPGIHTVIAHVYDASGRLLDSKTWKVNVT